MFGILLLCYLCKRLMLRLGSLLGLTLKTHHEYKSTCLCNASIIKLAGFFCYSILQIFAIKTYKTVFIICIFLLWNVSRKPQQATVMNVNCSVWETRCIRLVLLPQITGCLTLYMGMADFMLRPIWEHSMCMGFHLCVCVLFVLLLQICHRIVDRVSNK